MRPAQIAHLQLGLPPHKNGDFGAAKMRFVLFLNNAF
jgi:hypothetical protein